MPVPTHYGCHSVSGAALMTAITAAGNHISGMELVPVANGTQIVVIGK